MKDFISVNAKYYKSANIEHTSNHNTRASEIDYLLDDKNIKYENTSKLYTSNDSNSQKVNLDENDAKLGGKGTYSDNLKTFVSKKDEAIRNSKLMQKQFYYLQQQKKEILSKKYNYKENENENTIVEMCLNLSEEKALEYLGKGLSFDAAIDQFMFDIQKRYGLTKLSFDCHFDEGYVKNGRTYLNVHVHCVFVNFSFEKERSVLRRMKKKDWSKIQDIAQDSFEKHDFNFRRGISKKITKKEHLERIDFITKKKEEELKNQEKSLKALKNDIKKHSDFTTSMKFTSQKLKNDKKTLLNEVKIKKEEVKKIDNELKIKNLELEELNEFREELKDFTKDFIKNHTKKINNKYIIKNINNFYNSLKNEFFEFSSINIINEKIEELQLNLKKEKNKNINLEEKNNNLEKELEKIDLFQTKIDELISVKNTLEDENYELMQFIKSQNLQEKYEKFREIEEKEREIDR
ncbi:hypothetical protein [Arcobacter sp. CECT 8985]|uniref:hypothetical protein n=1 Tax=Arcobacter sp. CECT 8985 TaxID=1935424 RepID=UPI00100A7F67|nr:hypothetical protein [Arcobacter sp. CECT 8985]RXJ87480.1 hypothetical protein CRU93_03995 [Arcobacter sp. CECT 8985]